MDRTFSRTQPLYGYYENHEGLLDPRIPAIFRYFEVSAQEPAHFVHWHEGIELFYILEGKGEIIRDGVSHPVAPGNVVVIGSRQLHRPLAHSPKLSYIYIILEKELLLEMGFLPEQLHFLPFCSQDETLGRLARQLHESSLLPADIQWIAGKGLCYQLTAHLLKEYRTEAGEETPPKIRQGLFDALTFIHQHYREEICVDEICRAAGFSPSHFSRTFRACCGMSMIDYLNAVRCDMARRLLIGSGCSVESAALESGFTNLSHFYRMYKRHVGHLPSEEKKRTALSVTPQV